MLHWRLYALDAAAPGRAASVAAAPALLAEFAGFGAPADLQFSPDGRRVAYLVGGRLYAHDLGRDVTPGAPAGPPRR